MRSVDFPRDDRSISSIHHRRQQDDISDSSSDSGSSQQMPGAWPGGANSGGSNISGGFDAAGAALRGANFSRRTSRHPSSSGESIHPPRTLNGGESREELMEIIANLQEQMAGLAQQVHDGARGGSASRGRHEDPAGRRQRTQLTQQERLQARRARMEETHHLREMGRLDREEERLNRQREHEDFKLAHELQMQEFEKEKAQLKIDHNWGKIATQKTEMEVGMAVEAGNSALQLIRRGL